MKPSLFALSLLATQAYTQSAPQFEVVVAENLRVTYEASNVEVTPGLLISRNDTLEEPSITLPTLPLNQAYIVFMIDQDVHYNGTAYTMLHWFRPGLRRNSNDNMIPGASYNPPNPPPNSGAHRYTFILYEQPEDFSIPEEYSTINPPAETIDRVAFNLTAFALATSLGDPVAANYLRVINGTGAESSSAEAATGTIGIAPTEAPTFIASTTESEVPVTATATEFADASNTADASSPVQTRTEDSGAFTRDVSVGFLAGTVLAAMGISLFIA